MDKFPIIKTDRLRLRKPRIKDIPRIMEYADNPKVADMTLNIPHPYKEEDAIFWLNMAHKGFKEKSKFIFAICLLPTDEFIGGIGLRINEKFNRAELGFWIGEPFWNNGYATEATREVLKFGFKEVNIHKILATHLLNNPASGKVMTKNGMIKEGELKDHIKKGNKYFSLIQYRLTQNEFNNQK